MSNLAGLPPTGLKQPKAEQRLDYLARVRELPCCICEAFGEWQQSPTTAHHVTHGRHSQRKTPDIMAIPLCDGHHQAEWDDSKVALHHEPEEWKRRYGVDTDFIAPTQDKLREYL